MSIFGTDILFFALLIISIFELMKKRLKFYPVDGKMFLIFILWILAEVFLGWQKFGYRAFGETRYVYSFFAFFVPFFLVGKSSDLTLGKAINLLKNTIFVAAAAAFSRFVVIAMFQKSMYWSESFAGPQNLWSGKFLDSNQTFFLVLLLSYVVLTSDRIQDLFGRRMFLAFALLGVAVLSRNRASLVSLLIGLVVAMTLKRKFKLILVIMTVGALIYLGTYFFLPDSKAKIISSSYRGVVKVSEDTTGAWRINIQKSAFKQAMQTFWLGQGFGGYFQFYIPETGRTEEYPPHNQYIYLLLKTGIVGLALFCIPFVFMIGLLFAAAKKKWLDPQIRLSLYVLLAFFISQVSYGMAYDFIPLYGFFFGLSVVFLKAISKMERNFCRLDVGLV